jgi:hypothetical protein
VAPPTLRRAGPVVLVAFAAAALIVLALHGRRPDPGLVRFEAAGLMTLRPDDAREVRVVAGARRWRFVRAAGRWTAADGAAAPGAAESVDLGLRFLHVSSPQRVLERDEVANRPAAEFGLAPPRYAVVVQTDAGAFTVEFGGLNAQGLAQYARVPGREGLFLMPRFVGEPWTAATGLR